MTYSKHIIAIIIIGLLMFTSCKNQDKKIVTTVEKGIKVNLKYAEGFSIINYRTHTLLEISSPWPNSDELFSYALTNLFSSEKLMLVKDNYDGILSTPIQNIVVTSTTHIPSLELLGVENSLVGFPGLEYISSQQTRKYIDQGNVRELGKNEDINTEVLLELQPDAVIGFGVDGTNKTFETIKKAGIPVIYNGDWVENSPLAKAEWIKFFGVLFNKEKQADSIFNKIESDYLRAKELALEVKEKPTVLCGAMHKDIWYLPSGSSPEAIFLKDANVNYLWQDTQSKGSLALSFETVFNKARNAQLWLSPSNYSSLEALEKANSHYTKFDAFQNKTIYSFSNTTGKSGGVLYYEIGMSRPDLVLMDIIKICHPNVLPDYQPFFFKPLL